MKYAEKYGVSRASRKYNKSRSYIHPNRHTEAELKLIRDMRRRNPKMGLIELWHRLRRRGYTRRPESLFRVMRKMGLFSAEEQKETYIPKPYEQMPHPGERVRVDVKVVPRKCIADPELRLFHYTAIDEFTRLRFLAAYPEQSTYSSADFLRRLKAWYARRGIKVERSHREDQKLFYSCHAFYSLDDFVKQLAVHNRRSNNLPMRPLH